MNAYADALGLKPPAPVGGEAEPRPQPGMTGSFTGNPDQALQAIQGIRDPQERANATAAFAQQMQASGGKLPAPGPKVDPYASALGLNGPQPAAPAPAAAPAALSLQAPDMSGVAPSMRSVLANQVTGLGANIVGGYRGLATLATGGTLDDAANNARNYVQSHTYTPEAGTVGARAVDSFASPANPMNIPGEVSSWAGGKVTDLTGSPLAGAATETAGNLATLVMGTRGRAGTSPVEVGPSRPGTGVYQPVIKPATTPSLPAPGEPAPVVPQALPKQGQPAVQTLAVPKTPEAVQAIAEKAPAQLFPETPTVSPEGKFGSEQQTARAKILESVGIDPNKLRKSALAGDAIGGSTDFQTAKVDSPAGREMRSIIDGEKQALTNHADTLVKDTGGTHGVDQSALYARGNTIIAPLDSLKQWFDNKTSALYRAADERAQGVPTQLEDFRSVLGDASELTNSDRVHLQGAVNAYLKKLGMVGEDGSVTGSAKQAETVRKYLNEQWSPQNSRFVGKLKDALDESVTKAAGDDIYAEARRVRALRGQTLDNPNGIAKLMDSSGPEGINRSVPVEKIPDSLTGMPVDQFSHVIKTLKEAPPELQPQSAQALAEIKAQFANKVQAVGSAQQGQWNAKGVTKYLQNNAARMAQVFTPEEIQAFRNLNDAGHIVAKDQSYPGAAVQGHNLVTNGLMHGLPTAGAAIGGAVGGPAGAAVGAAAGRMAAGSVDNAVGLRAVKKRTTRLADLPD